MVFCFIPRFWVIRTSNAPLVNTSEIASKYSRNATTLLHSYGTVCWRDDEYQCTSCSVTPRVRPETRRNVRGGERLMSSTVTQEHSLKPIILCHQNHYHFSPFIIHLQREYTSCWLCNVSYSAVQTADMIMWCLFISAAAWYWTRVAYSPVATIGCESSHILHSQSFAWSTHTIYASRLSGRLLTLNLGTINPISSWKTTSQSIK